uniref:C-type lectin domain-containing protein n=1 Tax=Acrobeloides nanus TaxID=290746 RepID=A0A914C2M3_9BILA
MRLLIIFSLINISVGICPSGFIQGVDPRECYKIVTKASTWFAARADCESQGNQGVLVSIPNALRNSFVQDQLQAVFYKFNETWLGADTILNGGTWGWLDSTPFNYTNWDQGQPSSNTSMCATMGSSGKWYSRDCIHQSLPYVCKVNASISTASGICSPGYTYYANPSGVIKSCYKLILQNLISFDQAEALCQHDDAHLASVQGDDENKFLQSFAFGINAWLGFYRNNSVWAWTDGTSVNFTSWRCDVNPPGQDNHNCANILNTHAQVCCGFECEGGSCDLYGYWINNNCNNQGSESVAAAICQPTSNDTMSLTIGANGKWYSRSYDMSLPYMCEVTLPNPQNTTVNHCSQGYTYFSGDTTNSCYKLIFQPLITFNQSEALCQQDGAHLASIHDEEENTFLQSFAYNVKAWIGLYRNNSVWLWTDNTPFTYNNWRSEQNPPHADNANCANIYNSYEYLCGPNGCACYGSWIHNYCDNDVTTSDYISAAICKKAPNVF